MEDDLGYPEDFIRRDIKMLGVKNWSKVARDREMWQMILKETEAPPCCSANNEDDDNWFYHEQGPDFDDLKYCKNDK